MIDNAKSERASAVFPKTLDLLGCRQLLTPDYHHQVNGKVDRFNRTLREGWPHVRPTPAMLSGCACSPPGCTD